MLHSQPSDVDACKQCQCYEKTHTGNCASGSGLCQCRPEFLAPYCDQCSEGYYDYPNCKPCDCFQVSYIEICLVLTFVYLFQQGISTCGVDLHLFFQAALVIG